MVFPISDDNSDRRLTPWVNWAIIVLNVLVFVGLQDLGQNDKFTYRYATVPEEIATGHDIVGRGPPVHDPISGRQFQAPELERTPISVYITLLTSMFMHASIAHIAGNLWFLYIFGDNVEDDFGHARYLIFYLVCGVLASLSHVAMNSSGPQAMIPSLGASGAISGVMGAYLVLHPLRRVTVLLFRFVTVVPAWVCVGIWFAFQVISGMGLLGNESQEGGVAYAAHVGGLIAGVLLAKPFAWGREIREPVPVWRSGE